MAMNYLAPKQQLKIKSLIVDTNNYLNENFLSFDNLNRELSPGFCLIDTFSHWFTFYSVSWKDTDAKITYYNKLNSIYKNSLIDQNMILIISDTSIKNNITTSVLHIYKEQKIIAKTIHHVMNVISTKAKLFAIRCSINYVTQMQNITHIIIITDTIPAPKYIFDIYINYTLSLYLMILKASLTRALINWFHSGTVLVVKSGFLISWLTKS